MNAYFLYKADGSKSGYSACGECGQLALDANFDVSEKCCTCYECGLPIPKSERNARNIIHCRSCEKLRKERFRQEALEKAEIAVDYDGPVYYEGGRGSFGDGYFANVQELAEWLSDQDEEDLPVRPAYAFCCEAVPFRCPDIDGILESAADDMDEDILDRLYGTEELAAALKAFADANEGVVSYYEDRKRKVAIPR